MIARLRSFTTFHAPPSSYRTLLSVAELGIIAFSGVLAFLLRFDYNVSAREMPHLLYGVPIWLVVKSATFRLLRINRGSWRFFSTRDTLWLGLANMAGSAASAVTILVIAPAGFPRSLYLLDFFLCTLGTTGMRLAVRSLCDWSAKATHNAKVRRILIYGAGAGGVAVLRELRSNPRLMCATCGFIDDDPQKKGMYVQSVPVLGTGTDLRAIASKRVIDDVLIAIPSAAGPQVTRILRHCHDAGLRCKIIPGMTDVIEGAGRAVRIRDVDVEDLLGRSQVRLEESAILRKIENRVVLVTGAAGSIGSELCRQIARFKPSMIVAFELAETPLFYLTQEMGRLFPGVALCAEIGSIQNHHRLMEVFDAYHPAIVFHAAAYKHVPLMEAQVFEAVENNIFGTLNVALAAAGHGVEDFVMISTDKAVHPTSIMGVTKRVAELMVRSLQRTSATPNFVSVRFGNVLGSNGSVVPIFKRQIAQGGPVTVTHPEMRRYFMTIPEASQLVLQASTMGRGGEIFVLDMGEPVRIVDLARNLILLSGLNPDDIKIEFTGMRPGEKLFEELNMLEEDTLPTCHEKIKIFVGTSITRPMLEDYLSRLRGLCLTRDYIELVLILKELAPDYNPSTEILRRSFKPVERVNGRGTGVIEVQSRTNAPAVGHQNIVHPQYQ